MGYQGNLFADESLPKDMTEIERLFTTLEFVEGATCFFGESLDSATVKMLLKEPDGEGKYFDWTFTSAAESRRMVQKDIREKGFTIHDENNFGMVTMMPAWAEIVDLVHEEWIEKGLWTGKIQIFEPEVEAEALGDSIKFFREKYSQTTMPSDSGYNPINEVSRIERSIIDVLSTQKSGRFKVLEIEKLSNSLKELEIQMNNIKDQTVKDGSPTITVVIVLIVLIVGGWLLIR
jgi:hypothetical protein